MSAYLASPVTLIVFFVIAVTAVIAIVLTVRSNHRKEREWQQEKRAMERRVAMAIEAEMAGKEKARHAAPRLAKVKPQSRRQHRVSEDAPSPSRRSPGSVQRSEAIDDTTSALVATGILWDYDPPSRSHDSGSSHSSYDGGSSSSSSYDSGSSSSSSDSGSSGGGGGCD